MAPSFRPDPVYNIHLPAFKGAVSDLAKAANSEITDLAGLISALENRMDFFGENGCRISDHGIEYPPYIPCTDAEADAICNATRYQHSPDRLDSRAGSYKRKLLTTSGEVELTVL
jgi:glucuronate isomerase